MLEQAIGFKKQGHSLIKHQNLTEQFSLIKVIFVDKYSIGEYANRSDAKLLQQPDPLQQEKNP